ncbi:hypothetical protein [Flaviaesturariibacter amylovorans]|uniref:Exo-alpha-sialidase n=1 Tax=Flaviaesturariibacter amylovorans TaxID=1084520 RepID=A0ABP8H775_9BACT
MKKLFLLLVTLPSRTDAQWVNTNPGAGGQIQHLTCHPTIAGRMYFASDVEGFYQSNDFGRSWHYKGQTTPTHNTFIIQGEPHNANRIYGGFQQGFAISDDNARTWRRITLPTASPNMSVATIEIDPKDPNIVFVANSWLEDNPPAATYNAQSGETEPAVAKNGGIIGTRKIWHSRDRGATWTMSYYFPKQSTGDRNVYTISIHPTVPGRVVIANDSALVETTDGGSSWKALPAPAGAIVCQGGDFSPDGNWLYAVYNRNTPGGMRSGLFVRSYPDGDWQEIQPDSSNPLKDLRQTVWRPVVFKKSGAQRHYVLMGGYERGGVVGLYEAEVNLSGKATAGGSIRMALNYRARQDVSFDVGWNAYQNYTRTYCYFPPAWKHTDNQERGALVMAQQSFFVGDLARLHNWRISSTHYIRSFRLPDNQLVRMYRTNGTASTVNWDVAGYKNYVAQAQADNALVESYDGGRSWYQNNPPLPSIQGNCDAVAVALLDTPVVFASTQNGYGGALNFGTGVLRFKTLTNLNGPTDRWQELINTTFVNGEPAREADLKGLAPVNNRIVSIASDPHDPRRLFIACASGSSSTAPHSVSNGGVYVCDDIQALIGNPGNPAFYFRNIGTGGPGDRNTRKVVADAHRPGILYARSLSGTHRGERQPDGSYRWYSLRIEGSEAGLTGSYQSLDDLNTWAGNDSSYLALTRTNPNDGQNELWLSADEGRSFRKILDKALSFRIRRPAGDWYSEDIPVTINGVCGYGKNVFAAVFVRRPGLSKGISYLKGTIRKDGSITWADWTGKFTDINSSDLEFPVIRNSKIWLDEKKKPFLWTATHGSGSWKREIKP